MSDARAKAFSAERWEAVFVRRPGPWIVAWALLLRLPYALHPIYDIDEACYAAFAVAVNAGAVEYRDVADLKLPAIYWTYAAVFRLCGPYAMHAVHAVATFVSLAAAGVLFRLATSIGGRTAAFWTAFLYLTLTTYYPANLAANCELYMNLPYAAGAYFLCRAGKGLRCEAWCFAAGVALGVAVLYKQVAVAGVGLGVVYLGALWYVGRVSFARAGAACAALGVGVAAPIAAACGYLASRGALDACYFWTFEYLRWYVAASAAKLDYGLHFVGNFVPFALAYGAAWGPGSVFFFGSVRTVVAVLRTRTASDAQLASLLVGGWLLLSTAAPLSAARMYPHYWLQFLPPLALAAGLQIVAAGSWFADPRRRRRLAAGAVALGAASWTWAWAFVGETPPALLRPNPDYRPAVAYLRAHAAPGTTAFVWGWFPPLYVEAGLAPGTRFVNTQMFVTFKPEQAARIPKKWITDAAPTWIEHPNAWEMLEADFARRPPELVLDTSPGDHHRFGMFPLRDFPRLQRLVEREYRHEATVGGVGIYRRRASLATPSASAPAGGATR